MTLLYLVRHGETDWNAARRIQGATDIPLNTLGRSQAVDAAALLSRRRFDAVAASPLQRAFDTGSIIADRLGLPTPLVVPGVVERSYGEAEGMTFDEVEATFPNGAPVPGRESRTALVERVEAALLSLAAAHPGESVVVATHGAVIRSLVNHIAPEEDANPGVPIRNGSIHSFEAADGALSLVAFDDPIEVESEAAGRYEFGYQNALENRSDA
ncbi:phosphoglycerate mutase [Frondihabitans sp. PAMC 28766]|uniref:histidine phosphatase family protein n=1 Tax=Frondihabitans sp. PAMC 28766 TaxID=1795630 RepID=UPI00078B6618|nr:histidine phosphatase family protein [Frondihabitans sp. PAMC 28766]AMM20826.1 phosphoglycerate mutase [Frondihabitans sp. PAMC 28766]